MRRQMMSLALVIGGALILLLGAVIGPAPLPVSAMPALQPSPRPTLEPTPDLRTATSVPATATPVPTTATRAPVATATAVPSEDDDDGGSREPTAVPYGRVTGTVIDLRTNAPAPNILVMVGDSLVISDGNGNYDRWVVSGYYNLGLQLTSEQGKPIQGVQEIAVGAGDTVVVHLFFTSPAPVIEILEPTATPVVDVPTAAPPAPLPVEEPAAPVARPAAAPSGLPNTAVPAAAGPGLWMIGGALLLAAGVGLQLVPRRRRAAQQRLLDQLLHQKSVTSDADLLRDLLDRDA